jgi:DnaJ-class molecular chaperone
LKSICVIVILCFSGEVIKHEDKRVIIGEGMPMRNHVEERGDLVIHFNVDFPKKIPPQNLKQLHALLPGKPEITIADDATEYELEHVTAEMLQNSEREEAGGRRVECASQ